MKLIFGERSRYMIEAVLTRFETVEYFVTDAELIDEITGLPAVIRQSDTLDVALEGFPEEDKRRVRTRFYEEG